VMDFLSHNALFASGPFHVTSFALYSSLLSGSGSVYRVERRYDLS